MRFEISESDFVSNYGSLGVASYAKFIEKLNRELNAIVHPYAKIVDLRLNGNWTDAGNNADSRLTGNVTFLDESGEIGGEFVWLKKVHKFRGKAWSSLDLSTDIQLLFKARHSIRQEQYAESREFLNAIQDMNSLPRSVVFLTRLVDQKY